MNNRRFAIGSPVKLGDEWALVENIQNEWHSDQDGFVDIISLRWSDGHQTRHTRRELLEDKTLIVLGAVDLQSLLVNLTVEQMQTIVGFLQKNVLTPDTYADQQKSYIIAFIQDVIAGELGD